MANAVSHIKQSVTAEKRHPWLALRLFSVMPSTSLRVTNNNDGPLDEEYVQDAFHSYLKSSLAQAKAERLLDVEVLSSAEGDLMITGMSHSHSTVSSFSSCTRARIVPLLRSATLHDQPALSTPSPRRRR